MNDCQSINPASCVTHLGLHPRSLLKYNQDEGKETHLPFLAHANLSEDSRGPCPFLPSAHIWDHVNHIILALYRTPKPLLLT